MNQQSQLQPGPTRNRIRKSQIQGLSALAATSLALIGIGWLAGLGVPGATLWVLVWAGCESLLAFYSLSWSMPRSNRAFFSLFVGGALFRLISLGVAAWILIAAKISPAIPLLSLAAAYFILSIVQLPFLSHELR
jgi:hypothetical protein